MVHYNILFLGGYPKEIWENGAEVDKNYRLFADVGKMEKVEAGDKMIRYK